jgi:hypothetical protein
MERKPVDSSDLKSVGYDPDTMILEIEFNSGGVYQYKQVPSRIHAGLMSASSHGSYFHANIRNRYAYTRIQ